MSYSIPMKKGLRLLKSLLSLLSLGCRMESSGHDPGPVLLDQTSISPLTRANNVAAFGKH